MQKLRKLSYHENMLYLRVDEVLHYLWDPIGVADVPEARDEYYSYLPTVFQLLMNGDRAETIAEYLSSVSRDSMGLDGNKSRDSHVAGTLVNWRSSIFGTDFNTEIVKIPKEQMAKLQRRIDYYEKHPEKAFLGPKFRNVYKSFAK